MKSKLYIFDWNGTLQDDMHHIYECGVQRIFRQFDLPCPSMDTYRDQVTSDFMGSFYWPNGISKEVTAEDLDAIMCEGFKEKGEPPKLFPEAKSVLQCLALMNQHIAVVSGYDPSKLREAINRNGLEEIITEFRGGVRDKQPVFREMRSLFQVEPWDVICIGDTVEDAVDAVQAGAKPVIYPFGFHTRDKLVAFKAERIPGMVILNSLMDLVRPTH